MLEGENVNLKIMEKEDLPLLAEWLNNPEVLGEYDPLKDIQNRKGESNREWKSKRTKDVHN